MFSSLEEFERAYASANPAQQYLCSNSGNKMWSIAVKHGVSSDSMYKNFALLLVDVILGIQKTTNLPILLKQVLGVDDQTSNNITRDVLDFLAPLSDPLWQPSTTEPDDISLQMSAAEETLAAKFAPPNNQEPTYTSTQSAILNEGGQWGTR